MMTTGVRTPVGIRIVARDPSRLERLGSAIRVVAQRVAGTRSATFESQGGETRLRFDPDPAALAAYGVDAAQVRSTADLLITGGQVGEIEQKGRRFRVRVAEDVNARGPEDQLRALTVGSRNGAGPPVPLALLGRPTYAALPATLHTEGSELAAYVQIDLDDASDPSGYVERAGRELDHARAQGELRLEGGERIEWIGQYRLLSEGARRLRWIVPVVALSMLLLLYLQFRSLTEALIILLAVPFALVGSFWTIYLLGYPLSPAVWVGLLSVAGLAMQAGVVMVVYVDDAFYKRLAEGRLATRADIVAAHAEGTVLRLRPKIMTITTMAAGLLPLLWAEGPGAEIMRRVAAPMVGGLATSAFLTLEVLPVLYTIWRHRQLRVAQRLGRPVATIVGVVPDWASRPDPSALPPS
jgi:copper/silver efflux system protein